MTFIPALHPASDSIRSQWWFLFRGDRILVRRGEDAAVRPFFTDVAFVEAGLRNRQYLGCLNGIDCFTAELSSEARVSSSAELQPVRQLLG
ncbi:MAG: NUDIX-like domain-containing protein, partial [Desulfobacterales bacterium]